MRTPLRIRAILPCLVPLIALLATINLRAQTSPATTQATTADARFPAPRGGAGGARFMQMHESFLKRGKEGPIDVLFIGDSITEYWQRFPAMWDKHFGQRNVANFGIAGDITQGVLWRIDNGEMEDIKPKVVVLLIGTNNSRSYEPGQIAEAIGMIVKRIRAKTGAKVLLLAIFPRDNKADDRQTPTINTVNPIIARLDDGKDIRFLDIGAKFKTDDGKLNHSLFIDGVHLNAAGYDVWGNAMAPRLNEMIKQ
jgi:beta-glucosidase